MAESFKLELPEPDPNEEPLELEGHVNLPEPIPAVKLPGWLRNSAEESVPVLKTSALPPEPEPSRDPDELWRERDADANRDLVRFSLAELMIFTFLLAVILTLAKFVSLPILAGFLGGAVLLCLVIISTNQRSRLVYLCWITLLASYVLIAIWAAVRAV